MKMYFYKLESNNTNGYYFVIPNTHIFGLLSNNNYMKCTKILESMTLDSRKAILYTQSDDNFIRKMSHFILKSSDDKIELIYAKDDFEMRTYNNYYCECLYKKLEPINNNEYGYIFQNIRRKKL